MPLEIPGPRVDHLREPLLLRQDLIQGEIGLERLLAVGTRDQPAHLGAGRPGNVAREDLVSEPPRYGIRAMERLFEVGEGVARTPVE